MMYHDDITRYIYNRLFEDPFTVGRDDLMDFNLRGYSRKEDAEESKKKKNEELTEKIKSHILNTSNIYSKLKDELYTLTDCRLIDEGKTLYISIGQLGVPKPNLIVVQIPMDEKPSYMSPNKFKIDFINDSGHFSTDYRCIRFINSLIEEVYNVIIYYRRYIGLM